MNSGGVTVSYFEWTRNISHIRYGRLDRRLDHARRTNLVDAVEGLVDRRFDRKQRDKLTAGTSEEDLVNSGLEETMVTAFQEIVDIRNRHKKVTDLRSAAYLCAIEKVAAAYLELGIFP
jgi:glutamate dehydrogenase (NAD(P)+)